MKNTWYVALFLTLGLGVFPLSAWAEPLKEPVIATEEKAENPAKDDKEAAKEAKAEAEDTDAKEESKEEAKEGVEGAKDEEAASEVKEETKEEKKEEKKEEPLFPIDGRALEDADFALPDLPMGSNVDAVKAWHGRAKEIRRGSLADTYVWDDVTVRVHPDFLDTYNDRDDLSLGTLPPSGVTAWEITGGDMETARGIHVGSRRENVLRAYGRPTRISWDGEKGTFYFIYEKVEENLTFAISQDMVKSIRASLGKAKSVTLAKDGGHLPDTDFSLAGLTMHHHFKDYSFMEWEKKITNPDEEVWYYKGYAVRMTPKDKLIRGFFLTDGRMVTPRGLALGDEASTAELLYGAPGKLEMDTRDGAPRTASIYFSKGEENVFIIYLKNKKVDSIAVAENPQHKGNTPA